MTPVSASTYYTVQPFSFHGRGADYFGLWLKNTLLTVVTLGLYYPWARAARLRFEVGNLELDGSRFAFHGTGAEMFRGFLVLWLVEISVDNLALAGDIDLNRIGRGPETDATATADVFLDAAGLEGALDVGGMGLI